MEAIDQKKKEAPNKFCDYIQQADSEISNAVKYIQLLAQDEAETLDVPYTNPANTVESLLQTCKDLYWSPQKKKQNPKLYLKNIISNKTYIMQREIGSIVDACEKRQVQLTLNLQKFENQAHKVVVDNKGNKKYDPIKYQPMGKPWKLKASFKDQKYQLEVLSKDPIGRVKQKLQPIIKVPIEFQKFINLGQPLQDDLIPLEDSGLIDGAQFLVIQYDKKKEIPKESQIQPIFNINFKTQDGNLHTVSVQKDDDIEMIKKQISEKIKMVPTQYKLYYNGKSLQNFKSLSDYQIKEKSILYVLPNQPKQIENIDHLLVTIKINENQNLKIVYREIRGKQVKKIINQYVDNPKDYYAFIYNNEVLNPEMNISHIHDSLQKSGLIGCQLLVMKNEKFFFECCIRSGIPFMPNKFPLDPNEEFVKTQTRQTVLNDLKIRVLDQTFNLESKTKLLASDFIDPIQYYTSNEHYRKINKYLRDTPNKQLIQIEKQVKQMTVQQIKAQYDKRKEYCFTCSLVEALNQLPDYIGQVHRIQGIPIINGKKIRVRYDKMHKEGQVICWKGFTSTCKSLHDLITKHKENFIQNPRDRYTLYHIKSQAGKDIQFLSLKKDEKEVLFRPYSYFLIEKIQAKSQINKHQETVQFDQVWLVQIPTPSFYQTSAKKNKDKNTLVWVDDEPKNNLRYYEILDPKLEIIRLTSTQIARYWLKSFGVMYNSMGMKFKLITDMVRWQKAFERNYKQGEKNNTNCNYFAGIDLLELVYNKYGLTAKILVFCSDTKRAMKNIEQRKISAARKNRFKVTNDEYALIEYCSFEQQ